MSNYFVGRLASLIAKKHVECWSNPDKQNPDETLGILVAQYCEWDGHRLRVVVAGMLEDANYHTLAANIDQLWDEEDGDESAEASDDDEQ
jgi:hypothetical protein